MSPAKKKKKPGTVKPKAKPSSGLQKRLDKITAGLIRSKLQSEELLAKFADQTRKLLKLEAFCLWYQLKESDYRLYLATAKTKKWFEHVEPDQAGLADFLKNPGDQILNRPAKDLALADAFVKNLPARPELVSAFALEENQQKLLVCQMLSRKRTFSGRELQALKNTARDLRVLVQNAGLERISKKEAEQNRNLLEISRILNSSLNPKTVRIRAMEAVVRLLECEAGSLYLIDEARGELYFVVALGERADQVKEIRLKIGEGIAGWVAQSGEPLLIADASKDPRWASKADKKSKFQTRNMVTVPIKTKDRAIGVLQALNKCGGGVFDQEALSLMESLADNVAIALENALLHDQQRKTFFETAEALADAIEKRDPYTGGHTKRVRDTSKSIGLELGLDPDTMEKLDLASILHDIGKIGVEDSILRKPGKLTDQEFAQMALHPEHGFEILNHIRSLDKVIPGMRYHHERIDGRGYPSKLKDSEIPIISRIISVGDVWDAMTSDRPYRPALGEEVAIKELWVSRDKQLDPQMVVAFFKAYKRGKIDSQHRSKDQPLPEAAIAALTAIANENKLELG